MDIQTLYKSCKLGDNLTSLQSKNNLDKYINSNLEIYSTLGDIGRTNILVSDQYEKLRYYVWYDESIHTNQLLKFSKGDYVKITSTIRAHRDVFHPDFTIGTDLKYISLIKSANQVQKEQDELNRKKQLEELNRSKQNSSNSSNCFIATACYGNIQAEEVIVLRKYRDEVLIKHFLGRLFVTTYYKISPPIAKFIANSNWLKQKIKNLLLSPVVRQIKRNGKIN
jgi:hypothetical protein